MAYSKYSLSAAEVKRHGELEAQATRRPEKQLTQRSAQVKVTVELNLLGHRFLDQLVKRLHAHLLEHGLLVLGPNADMSVDKGLSVLERARFGALLLELESGVESKRSLYQLLWLSL